MRSLVNSHCSSRARRRSNPSLTGALIKVLTRLARMDNCMCSSRSKRRPARLLRTLSNPAVSADLSKVINSISGSSAIISLASGLPMIQVKRACGHAACSMRKAASA